jgi:hypothetical protein
MTDFEQFQETYRKYQQLFGLTGYKVYFKHEPIDDAFADSTITNCDRIATVRLNSVLPDSDIHAKHVERSAKHEAIHLLLNNLEQLAISRCIREGDISTEVEGLVFKLEDLIPAI